MGSNASLFPKICEVLAVGMGASSSEFRIPYFMMDAFISVQLYRELPGSIFHMSNCNIPFEAGEPLNESYGPCNLESSTDASSAA